jgi:GNAT superfamily N-acetyltransferase
MVLAVSVFKAQTASREDLEGYFQMRVAAVAVDAPDYPPLKFEPIVARLTTPLTGRGTPRNWVARCDGQVVGMATVGFPGEENRHLAMTDIVVRPDDRRRGIGTALLKAILPTLLADGRRLVEGWGVTKGGAGERWADALGFRKVHGDVLQTLVVANVDPSTWDVDPATGYRLDRWAGPVPDHLVASYAQAKAAIHDAPQQDSSYRFPQWTVQRIRDVEADLRARNVSQWTVVALDANAEVAALTEMEFHPNRPEHAYQADTSVVATHRGHGLGCCVKAAMMRWIGTDQPAVERIFTSTADTNIHMININHALGYATVRTMIDVEHDVTILTSRLAS